MNEIDTISSSALRTQQMLKKKKARKKTLKKPDHNQSISNYYGRPLTDAEKSYLLDEFTPNDFEKSILSIKR